jgi:hypothetical protein
MLRFKITIILFPLIFLFGQEKDRIFFQHSLHVDDMNLTCEECHTDIQNTNGSSWDVFPEMDLCLQCHDGDTADDACEYCHSNPDDPLPFSESWKVSGLGFSHSIHLTDSNDCNKCHSYIDDDDEIDLPHVWNESDCQACHMDLDAGPGNHNLAWKQLHGSEMNSNTDSNCALCHTNNSCEECHRLQQFTPETHPADYLFAHGFDAKAGVMECSTCHEIIEDCYSCHIENQVMPMNHNFHNWVNLSDGGLHGEFAESEAELCVTCHLPSRDSSCLKCHTGD